MPDVPLACACGKIKGTLAGASAESGTRIVCYCGDCQAFGHFLGRKDVLDEWAGISVFQTAPATITFDAEPGALACVRLSAKGLHRWYCAECKTPIGNTDTPGIAFIGTPTIFMSTKSLDDVIGPIRGHIQQKAAKNGGPPHPQNNLRVIARVLRKFASWKLRGLGRPNPFWNGDSPKVTPRVLSPSERSAL